MGSWPLLRLHGELKIASVHTPQTTRTIYSTYGALLIIRMTGTYQVPVSRCHTKITAGTIDGWCTYSIIAHPQSPPRRWRGLGGFVDPCRQTIHSRYMPCSLSPLHVVCSLAMFRASSAGRNARTYRISLLPYLETRRSSYRAPPLTALFSRTTSWRSSS